MTVLACNDSDKVKLTGDIGDLTRFYTDDGSCFEDVFLGEDDEDGTCYHCGARIESPGRALVEFTGDRRELCSECASITWKADF